MRTWLLAAQCARPMHAEGWDDSMLPAAPPTSSSPLRSKQPRMRCLLTCASAHHTHTLHPLVVWHDLHTWRGVTDSGSVSMRGVVQARGGHGDREHMPPAMHSAPSFSSLLCTLLHSSPAALPSDNHHHQLCHQHQEGGPQPGARLPYPPTCSTLSHCWLTGPRSRSHHSPGLQAGHTRVEPIGHRDAPIDRCRQSD